MVLFNSCGTEIEYVEVIKEVPVEVIVEVPVYDRSEINRLNAQIINLRNQYERELSELRDIHKKEIEDLNSFITDSESLLLQIEKMRQSHQKEIDALCAGFSAEIEYLKKQLKEEADYQLEELKSSYEELFLQLTETYNEKVDELQQANLDNESLLNELSTLKETYQKQLDELQYYHDASISELLELLSQAKKGDVFMLRVYKFEDRSHDYYIPNADIAKDRLRIYMTKENERDNLLEVIILKTVQLEYAVTQMSDYVKKDVNIIITEVERTKISYQYYYDGDYLIIWFIMWLF